MTCASETSSLQLHFTSLCKLSTAASAETVKTLSGGSVVASKEKSSPSSFKAEGAAVASEATNPTHTPQQQSSISSRQRAISAARNE